MLINDLLFYINNVLYKTKTTRSNSKLNKLSY